jgi:hypothetical protein
VGDGGRFGAAERARELFDVRRSSIVLPLVRPARGAAKAMLEPIDEEAMHEMLGWFMDTLEALAPPGVPQGELRRETKTPFA